MSYNGGASVAYGLNTVETLRQKDGLSGDALQRAEIIGPSSFNVLTSTETGSEVQSAGCRSRHQPHHVGNAQSVTVDRAAARPQSFDTGAFGYGLCPCNSDSGPGNGFTPLFQSVQLADLRHQRSRSATAGRRPTRPEGPSVVALGWEGYSLGFTDFAVAPVIGAYHMYAAVPPAYDTPQNPTPEPWAQRYADACSRHLGRGRAAHESDAAAAVCDPDFRSGRQGRRHGQSGRAGGGAPRRWSRCARWKTAATPVPRAWRRTPATAITRSIAHASGAQQLVLPDNLGELTQSGQKTASICPEATYEVYAAAVDYPAYEASYPSNLGQFPTIRGTKGQADVSTSDLLNGQYPNGPKR